MNPQTLDTPSTDAEAAMLEARISRMMLGAALGKEAMEIALSGRSPAKKVEDIWTVLQLTLDRIKPYPVGILAESSTQAKQHPSFGPVDIATPQ